MSRLKLTEYIKELQALKKIHGNIDLVYVSDDEGNGCSELFYSPTAGNYDGDEFDDAGEVNSICLN